MKSPSEILRAHLKKIGELGGKKTSAAKRAATARSLKLAREAKRLKRERMME